MAEGQGRANVPAQHRFARNPYLTAETAHQTPDLSTVMADRLVQARGAVRALRFTGRAGRRALQQLLPPPKCQSAGAQSRFFCIQQHAAADVVQIGANCVQMVTRIHPVTRGSVCTCKRVRVTRRIQSNAIRSKRLEDRPERQQRFDTLGGHFQWVAVRCNLRLAVAQDDQAGSRNALGQHVPAQHLGGKRLQPHMKSGEDGFAGVGM